jgi:hypothetical protein
MREFRASPSETFRFLHYVFGLFSVLSAFSVWRWVEDGSGAWAGAAVANTLFALAVLADIVLVGTQAIKADRW